MTHGGGWQNPLGDKANSGVIDNKVACWVAKGYIVISTNYPLWEKYDDGTNNGITPLEEAQNVAAAIAHAQNNVGGVDPLSFTLMGHSAGAHLTSLVVTSIQIRRAAGIKPIRGAVCLDTGCVSVSDAINAAHRLGSQDLIDLYEPFGMDTSKWAAMSPYDCLSAWVPPMMMVYSTNRGSGDERQNTKFVTKMGTFNAVGKLYPIAEDHGPIDSLLGEDNQYTQDVVKFIDELPLADYSW
jgi:acetyl esterase/lipase